MRLMDASAGASGDRSRSDRDMSEHLRITLDLDPSATPIAGAVEAGGKRTSFQGLLELVSLLERLRGAAPAADAGGLRAGGDR